MTSEQEKITAILKSAYDAFPNRKIGLFVVPQKTGERAKIGTNLDKEYLTKVLRILLRSLGELPEEDKGEFLFKKNKADS